MRKQFQGNSVKENKEGLKQGEQAERRIERAREIKREREGDGQSETKEEKRARSREECDSRRQCSGRRRGVMGGVPSALIVERIEI